MFAHELPLSIWLARQFPEHCPAVHAAMPEHGWLLLREAPGTPLDQQPDLGRWAAALRQHAELQVATVPHAATLAALGLPDRGGAALPSTKPGRSAWS